MLVMLGPVLEYNSSGYENYWHISYFSKEICVCSQCKGESKLVVLSNVKEIQMSSSTEYPTALDKTLFSTKKYWYFSYFSMKTYVVGTQ